ncbi:phosphate acyltransferase PlsX [candidate division WOR-3 bacterium]|nr:phosphate acyltransferase PlsX [candidate division WOR-3 bacterium]
MIIGIDAMGGDYAPQVVIDAVKDITDLNLRLIGDKTQLEDKIDSSKIIHAPTTISMDELPQKALRKKDSSIAIGTQLQKTGQIDAFVGAGNTGAYMIFASLQLGRLKGVRRPALGTFFPTKNGSTFILDVGATILVKPEDLFQFGIMGVLCIEGLTGKKNPSVALLSIGEEDIKGNTLTREAFKLLQDSHLNFIGNIEGHKILDGVSDVVICEGVVGNTLLKFGESIIAVTYDSIKEAIKSSFKAKIGGVLLVPSLKKFFSKMNYEEYGGALLLGTKGVTIICHGRSTSKAIRNAIYTAAKYVKSGVNEHIESFFRRREAV